MATLGAYFGRLSSSTRHLASPKHISLDFDHCVAFIEVEKERHLRYTRCLAGKASVRPSKLLEDLLMQSSSLSATPAWGPIDPEDIFGPELGGDINPLDLGGSTWGSDINPWDLDALLSTETGAGCCNSCQLVCVLVIRHARQPRGSRFPPHRRHGGARSRVPICHGPRTSKHGKSASL
jgi:hypothetical protein